jgi:hypothetical protein
MLGAFVLAITLTSVAADKLEAARAAYLDIENERAQQLLDEALAAQPTDDEWLQIQEMRAVMYAAYDRRNEARETMRTIIERRPGYTPPPQSSPKILEAYGAAKAIDMNAPPPPPRWYANKWIWIGAGVVAAAATTWAIIAYNNPDAPDGTYPVVRFGGQ